jgi:hypothetical protein
VPLAEPHWATLKKEEYLQDVLDAVDDAQQEAELKALHERAEELCDSTNACAERRKEPGHRNRTALHFIPDDRQACLQAKTEWRSKQAAAAEPVKTLRADLLPDGRLLTPEQVEAFFDSPAPRFLSWRMFQRYGVPFIHHVSRCAGNDEYWELSLHTAHQLALYVEPPGEVVQVRRNKDREDQVEYVMLPSGQGTIRQCLIWPGSVLDDLRRFDAWFVRRFDCQEGMGLWFLLTGELCVKPSVVASWQVTRVRHRAGPCTHARIYLDYDASLSGEDVAQCHLRVQAHIFGHEARPMRAAKKTFNVFRFVVAQMSDDGQHPPWSELLRKWNDEHPDQQYEATNRLHEDLPAQMKRDYENACRSILAPDLRVPDEQIEELDARHW